MFYFFNHILNLRYPEIEKQPIIIYQMGKVGSQSIYNALVKKR